ncbi:S-layer homology domain-containing protein [Paenibacillus sp. RC67]|uniref:S-layer homology domain-containing protein n=1 Tax=Paenibacillus sp. RC67 TaxID=3039392 RepID=UPI0024AE2196|nr:S-layer homology domain-containing protein [Paenibacillus sp. RC67]
MRESSSNLFKQNSQQPKDIRGGEKKVMKKSLSTILSLAMAFSMFSSVAFGEEAGKTSANFSDLKDLDAATKAKFDEMISAGIFDGVKEDTFGLKDKMNRAQFAKVAALVFKLKVDTSLKTSSFTDVKADDPANGYALPYIEAVKAAGITDGYAPGEFNPAGEVTKEQLATFLIRGLGKDSEGKATPGVNDKTVTDWAKGYVALALQLKLLSNGADGTFAGTSAATRDLLVLSSYEAKKQYKSPFNGKYSIASFKATNANELTLELNGALTDEAAKALKIEVKKDGNVLSSGYTTKWNDDKTKAVLTFDTKFIENKFDVTISGASNIDDTAKTASVSTTKEKVTKIDFLTASDTIPLAVDKDGKLLHKVRIDFKATNQYGQKASFNASQFDIRVSDGSFATIAGEQAINLSEDVKQERNDRINITILHEDSQVNVSKIFTVGDKAIVSKVEVGDLLNSAGNKVDVLEANTTGYIGFKAYDQYGLRVEDRDLLNDGITVNPTDRDLEVGDDDKNAFVDNVIGDDAADLKIRSVKNEEKKISVSIFARGGQSVVKDITIKASKVPATVEFGSYNYTLAENDVITNDEAVDSKFYVPLIVKDSKGDQLSAQEIVDAFNDDKIDVRSSSGIDLDRNNEIAKTGSHKGQIQIKGVGRKGTAQLTVTLKDIPNVRATTSIQVGDAREAQEIKFSTQPKKQMVSARDGKTVVDNELKFKIYDQNGSELKYNNSSDYNYFVRLSYTLDGSVAGSDQTYLASKQMNADKTRTDMFPSAATKTVSANVYSKDYNLYSSNDLKGQEDWANFFDKSFKIYSKAGAPAANYTVKAELFKYDKRKSIDTAVSVDSKSQNVEVIDPTKTSNKLTYEVYLDKGVNNTILAGADYLNLDKTIYGANGAVSQATYINSQYNKLGKEVKVRAKNSSGEEVKVPNLVTSIGSTNRSVADFDPANPKIVFGLIAGTSSLNVVYTNAKNESAQATLNLTTKNESPSVASISLKKTGKDISRGSLVGKYLWDGALAEKITVKDQYGDEIVSEKAPGSLGEEQGTTDQFLVKDGTIGRNHIDVLGISFYVSDIVGTGTVTIDKTGKVTAVDAGVQAFTINVMATSGVTSSFAVTVNN